ncbi:MAG TPA: glutamine synthetase family protein [Candidatus Nanopelagicales bacterium]|jgi:glutamine synthetase
MSEPSGAVQELVRDLSDRGVDLVRVLWSDLHGVARGKDIALSDFARVNEHGVAFCQALLVTDLGANPLDVPESSLGGWPDAVAVPDLGTMRVVDYVDNVAVCVCDINTVQGHDTHSAQPLAFSPRDLLRAQADGLRAEGLHPVIGPELEFYLCHKDSDAPHGWARYQDRDTGAYIVGVANDPDDMLATLLRHCSRMGLSVFAGNHEFSGGQFEINHLHSEAVDAADRVFLFKHAVKEIAVLHGLRATFMGKPFEGRSGSGTHLHVSLTDAEGSNLFDDPADARGLSPLAYSFLAGVLVHAGSLTALLNPTVNAFKRLGPDTLAPAGGTWGFDNRTAYVRVPPERGAGARLELRIGDGTANPYLAFAGVLAAGHDGIRRGLTPPPPITGHYGEAAPDPTTAPPPTSLPATLAEALSLLERDTVLVAALGERFVSLFAALKRQEIARFERSVTDWEFHEYAWLL